MPGPREGTASFPHSRPARLANVLQATQLHTGQVLLGASQGSDLRVIEGRLCVSLDLKTHQQSCMRGVGTSP